MPRPTIPPGACRVRLSWRRWQHVRVLRTMVSWSLPDTSRIRPRSMWRTMVTQVGLPCSLFRHFWWSSLLAVYSFNFPEPVVARGGPLQGNYQFSSLHFHWGAESDRGAEHVVDGKRHTMEMHLVFYNQIYGSFDNAKTQCNGLAVLGVFFQNSTAEPDYRWIPALYEVQTAGTSYTLPDPTAFNIKGLIGARRKPYFSYHGSLTTPPYYESVTWLVMKKPLQVSENQMSAFRSLKDEDGNPLVDNYRELQPINGRTILLYSDTGFDRIMP